MESLFNHVRTSRHQSSLEIDNTQNICLAILLHAVNYANTAKDLLMKNADTLFDRVTFGNCNCTTTTLVLGILGTRNALGISNIFWKKNLAMVSVSSLLHTCFHIRSEAARLLYSLLMKDGKVVIPIVSHVAIKMSGKRLANTFTCCIKEERRFTFLSTILDVVSTIFKTTKSHISKSKGTSKSVSEIDFSTAAVIGDARRALKNTLKHLRLKFKPALENMLKSLDIKKSADVTYPVVARGTRLLMMFSSPVQDLFSWLHTCQFQRIYVAV